MIGATLSEKYTHLQINLVFTTDSNESLVYDILDMNMLHTGHLTIQLARYSRYRSIFSVYFRNVFSNLRLLKCIKVCDWLTRCASTQRPRCQLQYSHVNNFREAGVRVLLKGWSTYPRRYSFKNSPVERPHSTAYCGTVSRPGETQFSGNLKRNFRSINCKFVIGCHFP
ncbi:hypothetical protein T265_10660 [Opisthorchis viverrini]|uniref:Uncharacterized protein n=1 Tax=Opisthorchis viverrini TaxID=6198 RepID=A0A074Z1D8_OPIVI|nr:hypothetical protein T265_10660 [Opisthorchis viverrini]KER20871.1 hypothetical protein T265_10660 [Opisthorchis viverrini]